MGKVAQLDRLSEPTLISEAHRLDNFNSGETVLDDWLRRRALKNDRDGASRTFVVHHNQTVIAYYALATGSVIAENAPGSIRRKMPNPIPVMILGRLAVDQNWQGLGLGRGLLKDAALRTFKVARDTGIRAILTHAISDTAKHFYKRHGFVESVLEPMTLMVRLHDIEKYFS